jgi:hypothetical protein
LGILLVLSKLGIPQSIQKQKLEVLFNFTAEAFNAKAPSLKGLSLDEGLKQYALFTRDQATMVIEQGGQAAVEARLFESASRFGREIRTTFQVATPEDVMVAGALIYRLLKIDFEGKAGGDVAIKRCFFSAYYSPRVCQIMSSLDAGVMAGLSGGGKFTFSRRITEGNSECCAHLELPAR